MTVIEHRVYNRAIGEINKLSLIINRLSVASGSDQVMLWS